MEGKWSGADEVEKLECAAANTSFVKDIIDPDFKLHYRGQMIGLMQKIIKKECDPNHDCTGDSKRETNLSNQMKLVRRLKYTWPDLTSIFLTGRDPVHVSARKILEVMSECEDEMDVNDVLYLCTSITDQCVLLAAKNYDSMTCEIVASLVDFILDQNMLICRDFLFWLDCL